MPSLLPLAIGAIVLAFVGQYALKYYQRRQKALAAGCLPAPHYGGSPFSWLALDTVRTSIAADNEKRFPDLIMERHEEMTQRLGGPNKRYIDTFAINMLNEEMYVTCDPKNIQALLATQFKDFGLGDARNGNFAPLLGHGIVSHICHKHSRSLRLIVQVRLGWPAMGRIPRSPPPPIRPRTSLRPRARREARAKPHETHSSPSG